MSKFKISGQERRNLKKLLNEYKSYEKGFWHYHQLDKDMCAFITPTGGAQKDTKAYPMSDEEAQKRYDKLLSDIDRITKQLEEKAEECPHCHKVGYHKMSCTTQKVTVFVSDENPEQKDISKMETTESGVSEFPTYQADRKIGNTDFVFCSRVNRLDNNRCVNCGAKIGNPCQMNPNESNYC